MIATTHVVAPHTQLERHKELARSLDALFRRYRVPPAILQHSFADRRPCMHYTEVLNLLTPFPAHPSSELLQDIGRTVSPLQSRLVGLQSSYYPPVFPPVPTGVYAPNEDQFIVTRSTLKPLRGPNISCESSEFGSAFESRLVLHHGAASETHSTLKGSLSLKTNPDKRGATITIFSPSLVLRSSPSSSTDRHPYTLHSLSASARRDPISSGQYTLTPHFGGTPDRRFERTCSGLRHECTWHWEILDDQLREHGIDQSEVGKSLGEHIVIDIPPVSTCTSPRPLSISFTATLGATAGLDAIDHVHRTHWSQPSMQNLQRAFDCAHPAVQILHHVVRIEIPDLGDMIHAGIENTHPSRCDVASDPGMYAPGEHFWAGELRAVLDQDAGVLGRLGDEDEDGNSDEESGE